MATIHHQPVAAFLIFCHGHDGDCLINDQPVSLRLSKIWPIKTAAISNQQSIPSQVLLIHIPIGSMYGIYANIYHQYTPNVSIYTIHGSYGFGHFGFQRQPCPGTVAVFQALLRAARSVSKKSTSSETTQIAPREARCLGSLICTV